MDSLLKRKIDQHGGRIYRAHDGSDPATAKTLLWPTRWTRERLIKKRNEMISAGQSTNAYAQEYLNDPVSDEERTFKYAWLFENIPDPHDKSKTYRVPAVRTTMAKFKAYAKRTVVNGYAMVDAGDATTENADFTGVIVHFVDAQGNRFRVDVRREKRNITDLLDLLFEIWTTWRPLGLLKIGMEKKAFHDQVEPLLKLEKKRRQIYPIFEELKPLGRSKENRIKGALEGLYQAGKVFSVCEERGEYLEAVGDTLILLEELYNFPSSKHDDLSDAEAYGEDVIVIPTEESKLPTPHRDPVDDPFEPKQAISQYEEPIHSVNSIESDPFE
jgi:phage terminase large subunit-like protein